MVGEDLQRLADAGFTRLVAQQLVGQQAPFFVEQVRAAPVFRRPGQLEIDELDTKLEVAAFAVPATRVGERLRQHLCVDPGAVARV